VHLLLVDQAPGLRERLVGVARRVGRDDLDLAAARLVVHLLPEQREAVPHVLAGRGERAGQRDQEADPDRLALRLDAGGGEQPGEHEQRSEASDGSTWSGRRR
jgi:hypothetical protein